MPINKILVVDDSPTERHVLVELLTRKGYQVLTAESGEEGIEKAKSEQPDLVLMDVVMPGLNGYQATRTLTRDDATKHIPVIVCTSKGQDTDKIWGLRQGAQDYMVKPINPEELLAKIAAL
ncbi:MAG: response regulator [Propionivibrio sp.]